MGEKDARELPAMPYLTHHVPASSWTCASNITGPLSLEDKKASLSPVLLASSDSPTRCARFVWCVLVSIVFGHEFQCSLTILGLLGLKRVQLLI